MIMTDNELKQLVASLAVSQKETNQQIKEMNQQTDKKINELGKQIGGLGRKFGSFTEGLALPSMQKILQNKFNMEVISPSVRVHKYVAKIKEDIFSLDTPANFKAKAF